MWDVKNRPRSRTIKCSLVPCTQRGGFFNTTIILISPWHKIQTWQVKIYHCQISAGGLPKPQRALPSSALKLWRGGRSLSYYGINDLLLDPFICINKMLVGFIQNCDRSAARSINFLSHKHHFSTKAKNFIVPAQDRRIQGICLADRNMKKRRGGWSLSYYGINDLLLALFICINKMLVGLIQNCDRSAVRWTNFIYQTSFFYLGSRMHSPEGRSDKVEPDH
jgi:hypothetical protein